MSKFSKVSLFSGLNNLQDITLDPRYSAVCGYTDQDLDAVFAPHLAGLDRDEIRDWYNGYSWRGDERVYNPFDILLLLDRREFGAWWFETGTPHVPHRHPVRAPGELAGPGSHGGQRRAPVGVRRRPHRDGGVAVPDRVSHHPPRGSRAAAGCSTGSATPTGRCARA